MAVAVTVPAGSMVPEPAVALGSGEESVAAPPHPAIATTKTSAKTRMSLGTAGTPAWFPHRGTAPANVTGRIHLFAERQDLVVDPACLEHRLLRLVPAGCAVAQQTLPDDKPDRAVRMAHTDELGAEPIQGNALQCEAEHQTVAPVLRSERHAKIQDVELSGEVLDRAVVGCDATDTEGRHARFDAQFGDDLDGGAHPARSFHLPLKSRERGMHKGSHGVRYDFAATSGAHRRRRRRDAGR